MISWQGREYATINKLNNGETIEFEGMLLRKTEGELKLGDTYIAERNTGPQLLTVKMIATDNSLIGGFVIPEETGYCYDLFECVKIQFVE